MKDVGPSTPTLFHGGDTGRDVERRKLFDSTSFRFLEGGPSGFSFSNSSYLTSTEVRDDPVESVWIPPSTEARSASSISGVTRSC